jgi:hypothetical protein
LEEARRPRLIGICRLQFAAGVLPFKPRNLLRDLPFARLRGRPEDPPPCAGDADTAPGISIRIRPQRPADFNRLDFLGDRNPTRAAVRGRALT